MDPAMGISSTRVTETHQAILPLESLQRHTMISHRPAPSETDDITSLNVTRSTSQPSTNASIVLTSSEMCLHIPPTRLLPGEDAPTSCPPSPELVRRPKKRPGRSHYKTKWFIGGGSINEEGKSKYSNCE